MVLRHTMLTLAALLLTSPALAERPQNAGEASLRLEQGMSEKDVLTAMESQPNSSSVLVCGTGTGKPWPCKIWKYEGGTPSHSFSVYFQKSRKTGAWVVDSWTSD
jgi:hypothetical protein